MGEKLEITSKAYLSPFGITRAEERLYLTCAQSRTIFGRSSFNNASRFLREISEDILESISKGGSKPEVPFASSNRSSSGYSKRTLGAHRHTQPATARLQATGGDQFGWKAGDKAIHKKWGTGMVVSVKGEGDSTELDIAFPQPIGIKRLLAQFAPIEKA
nr:hypothetical protein [Lysinibacillus mangiferihumi]